LPAWPIKEPAKNSTGAEQEAFDFKMGIAEALSKDVRDDKGAALYFLPVSAGLDLSK